MLAGYIPGRTATVSTTVYQLWRTDNEEMAMRWVLINLLISSVVLVLVNLMERSQKQRQGGTPHAHG
jgi:molybdate transport system permease protein